MSRYKDMGKGGCHGWVTNQGYGWGPMGGCKGGCMVRVGAMGGV